MGPFGGSFVVFCVTWGNYLIFWKIRVLAPFDLFYHYLQLSCLLRFRPKPRNPTFIIFTRDFGRRCMSLWVQSYNSARLITLKQMVRLRESIEFWKIFLELVFWTSEDHGKITFIWWSLLIITVTSRVLVWHHMRHYMEDRVTLRHVGWKLEKSWYLGQRWFDRLRIV